MDPDINILAAWIGMLFGFVSGAIQGLLFHKENWLGGYNGWPRRMTRLGHISFFGLAFVNLAFALSAHALEIEGGLTLPALAFITGAITMPLFCYLSAWIKPFRHGFVVPVASILTGTIAFFVHLVPS